MVRLQEQLKYFVHNKLSTDKLWQNVRVYLSGHEVRNGALKGGPSCYLAARCAAAELLHLSLCAPHPHRRQVRENTRSWNLFAPRARGQITTQTPDTASTVWMPTWWVGFIWKVKLHSCSEIKCYFLCVLQIMLGLTSHEPNFSLLREEVRFGGKKSQKRFFQ